MRVWWLGVLLLGAACRGGGGGGGGGGRPAPPATFTPIAADLVAGTWTGTFLMDGENPVAGGMTMVLAGTQTDIQLRTSLEPYANFPCRPGGTPTQPTFTIGGEYYSGRLRLAYFSASIYRVGDRLFTAGGRFTNVSTMEPRGTGTFELDKPATSTGSLWLEQRIETPGWRFLLRVERQ